MHARKNLKLSGKSAKHEELWRDAKIFKTIKKI